MQTMRRLTESRPVDADRNEFFTDAEIFACIIGLRLVGAAGEAVTYHITRYFIARHLPQRLSSTESRVNDPGFDSSYGLVPSHMYRRHISTELEI